MTAFARTGTLPKAPPVSAPITLSDGSGCVSSTYGIGADELKKVYEALSSRFVLTKEEREVTALFAAVAALLTLFSAGLSLLWFHRLA
jgi:hypothetical protein